MIPVTTIDTAIGAVIGGAITALAGFFIRNFRPTLVYNLETLYVDPPEGYEVNNNIFRERIQLCSVSIVNKSFFSSDACTIHVDDCNYVVTYRIDKSANLSKEAIKFELNNGIGIITLPKISARSEVKLILLTESYSPGEYTSVSSTTADVKVKKYRKKEAADYVFLLIGFVSLTSAFLGLAATLSKN